MGEKELGELLISIRADMRDLHSKMTGAETRTKTFAKRSGSALASLKKNWLALTAATAGIVIALRGAWQAYSQFENKMREVNSLMGLSEKQYSAMTEQVRRFSLQLPQSSTELANALYGIVSAGQKGSNALAVLYRSAKAATAGVTDTETAARAGMAAINAYGMEISELDRVYDIMFMTVKEGVLTFPDLANNLGQVLPVARAAGVNLETVGAAMATMTKGGMPVAVATTALRNAISKLAAPTKEAKDAMKAMGIEYNGLVPTLQKIAEAGIDLEGMKNIIPDERASRGVLALTQRMGEMNSTMEKMKDSSGAMQEAFDEMLKSPVVQAKLLGNALGVVRDRLIQAWSPAIMSAIGEMAHQMQIVAITSHGMQSEVGNAANHIRNLVGVAKIAFGITNTILDSVILAITSTANALAGVSAFMKGQFSEAAHSFKVIGHQAAAYAEAVAKRYADIDATWSSEKEDVEDPAWLKTLEELMAQKPAKVQGLGGGEEEKEEEEKEEEKPEGVGVRAALKSEMSVVAEQAKQVYAELDKLREADLISTQEYYAAKKLHIQAHSDMEIKYLQQIYELTDDENEKRQINAEILKKLTATKTELIQLDIAEAAALDQLAAKQNQIMQAIQQRLAAYSTDTIAGRYNAELRMLDEKHAAEIAALEEAEATKDQIKEAHRMQNIERERATVQASRQMMQEYLGVVQEVMGMISDIYAMAYEAEMERANKKIETTLENMRKQGASEEAVQKKKQQLEKTAYKKAKELWEKQKAAQIAMAVINAAQAIIRGYADHGPVAGSIFAVLTAAVTGFQIAKISAQEFPGYAAGGLVNKGAGPRRDDVPARLSRGEYVEPSSSVDYYGPSVFEALRRRIIPRSAFTGLPALSPHTPGGRFATGGMVSDGGIDDMAMRTTTIVNVLDPAVVPEFLATPEGQDAVINVIADRRMEIQRIVGG